MIIQLHLGLIEKLELHFINNVSLWELTSGRKISQVLLSELPNRQYNSSSRSFVNC